ncbi:MAG: hypothetical protein OEY14_11350, partial [Myxococcales bacterium]|nr:hypothetical protein [Myxococcales bacterium]
MSRLVIALLLGQLALSAGCYQSYPWLAEREDGGHWTPTPDAAGDRDAGAWDGSLRDSGSHDGSLRDASLRDASSIDA